MKKYFNIILFLSLVVVASSCKKYLDVVPKGVVVPEKTSEFELMLNSETMTSNFPEQLFYATDQVSMSMYTKLDNNPDANSYFWATQLNTDVEASPAIWGPLYRSIYNTNVIINKVMGSTGGSDAKKQQVLGEALVLRSAFYFDLATAYSKAYDPATAVTNPGLPLVSSIDVTNATPQRSSLKATFDTIVTNLKTAADFLPTVSASRARVNKYVAYGILSRVYLYMQDYTNAELYAGKAMAGTYTLLDYNSYKQGYLLPISEQNPEVLWHRLPGEIYAIFNVDWSNSFVATFNTNDLRKKLYVYNYGPASFWNGPDYGTFGINLPEIMLTQAEAMVHNHNVQGALDNVNKIRAKRFKPANYVPLTAATEDAALKIVLDERSWELAMKGTRWMDMKRLDAQGKMPAVTRVDDMGDVLETLAPKSTHYTFEIPNRVLMFNPSMIKNFN